MLELLRLLQACRSLLKVIDTPMPPSDGANRLAAVPACQRNRNATLSAGMHRDNKPAEQPSA
jgi:hypothetical protein